jgi:hypothetical protein
MQKNYYEVIGLSPSATQAEIDDVSTLFAGNVREIDIPAFANGISVPIQVKAVNGNSWQFDIRSFLDVTVIAKPPSNYSRKELF